MRTLNQCFYRNAEPMGFSDEGRGLGFSWGGWHPFRANTYLPTLKKLDPLSRTSLGKAVWKPIDKTGRSINKDFAKGKRWSQNHRKQLQIAAAIALAAVGGAYYLGYLGTTAGAAGATGAAATGAVATGAAATGAAAAGVVAAPVVATGGFWAGLGTVTASLTPLMALSKLVTGQPAQSQGYGDYGPGYNQSGGDYSGGGSSGGYSGGGGGGGSLGPAQPDPVGSVEQASERPSWILPAAGAALLLYFLAKE